MTDSGRLTVVTGVFLCGLLGWTAAGYPGAGIGVTLGLVLLVMPWWRQPPVVLGDVVPSASAADRVRRSRDAGQRPVQWRCPISGRCCRHRAGIAGKASLFNASCRLNDQYV